MFLCCDASALFANLSQRASIDINNSASVFACMRFTFRLSKLKLTSENPIDVCHICFSLLVSYNFIIFGIKHLKVQLIEIVRVFVQEQSHVFTHLVHTSDIGRGFCSSPFIPCLLRLQSKRIWYATYLALHVHFVFVVPVIVRQ